MAEQDNRALAWMRAVRDSDLESTMKHVLLTLGTRMDPDGGSCYPSTRTLAADTGLSRRTVEKHLRSAEERGWLRRERAGHSGQGWRRNRYVPVTPTVGKQLLHLPAERGESVSPPHPERGETDDTNVGKELPTTSSVTSSETDGGERGEAGSPGYPTASELTMDDAGRFVYPDAFEATWSVYPDREGRNPKKAAYKKWRARVQNGAEPQELHEATEAFARRMDAEGKTGTTWVKHAATFFGPDDHWREELQEARARTERSNGNRRDALDAIEQGGRGE